MVGTEQTGRDTRVMGPRNRLRGRDGRDGSEIVIGTCHHDRRCRMIMQTGGKVRQITRTVIGVAGGMYHREAVVGWVVVDLASHLLIHIFRAMTGMVAAADASHHEMTDDATIGTIGTTTGIGEGSITTTGLETAGREVGVGHRLLAIGIAIGTIAGEMQVQSIPVRLEAMLRWLSPPE